MTDLSTLDKDIRRVLGKKLYEECRNHRAFITERSNGDAEYHLNSQAYLKLKKYMNEHRKSRLYKYWTGIRDGTNVRFQIDSWQ